MKIAMLISRFPPHVGGTENQAFRLSKRLIKEGIHVEVVTQRHDPTLPNEEMMDGVRIIRCGVPGTSFWGSLSYLLRGLILLSRSSNKADIYHAHMIAAPAVLACLAKCLYGGKVLVKVACSGPLGDVITAKKSLLGRIKLAFVLRMTSQFACVSHDIEAELTKEGISREKITFISNGVDIEEFVPAVDGTRGDLERKLNLSKGKWVLFSGRLTQQKRPLELLEAFIKVSGTIADARLLYIGEGDLKDTLMDRILRSNFGSKVLVKPPQENISEYYRACDIFVLNSEAEGLSNSLLEAMATGLVCIGSRVGGTVDVIEDGVNGYLMSEDSSALSDILALALGSENKLRQMGERARRTVMDQCELGAVAKKYKEAYGQILAKR